METKRKKTGGREKGTPNKATSSVRTALTNLVLSYFDMAKGKVEDDLSELEPKERLNAMIKLATFVIPKMQAIEFSAEADIVKTIEDKLCELAEYNEE